MRDDAHGEGDGEKDYRQHFSRRREHTPEREKDKEANQPADELKTEEERVFRLSLIN